MNSRHAGLYLHFPFCSQKCGYCDFYSYAAGKSHRKTYVSALHKALAAFAKQAEGVSFDSVYFGGGTPSLLDETDLAELLAAVSAYYKVERNAEITLEANPGTLNQSRLESLFAAGMNRLSLGMQSALDCELALLGRSHTFAETKSAVWEARKAGFSNIALDLMLGIPSQTKASLSQSLDELLALSPDHVSAYMLKIEENTPFFRRYPQGEGLPGEEEQAEFYLHTCETLAENGFVQEEISNFAKIGKESVHNQKYWTLAPYLGLGPGAHSDFGGRRFFFPADTNAFCRAAAENRLHGLLQTEDEPDRLAETIFLALRTGKGLSAAALAAVSADGEAEFRRIAEAMAKFTKPGFVILGEDFCRLTPAGFLLSNALMAEALAAVGR